MKTITNIIMILIVLILNACNYQLDHYRLDSSVTDRQATLIQMAMYDWCDTDAYCPVIDESGDGLIKMVPHGSMSKKTWLGSYQESNTSKTIKIDETLDDKLFIQVVIHELGHAAGCRHLHDGSIMEANIGNVETEYNDITDSMIECAIGEK